MWHFRTNGTVPDSIRELEKIEMIRQADGVYRLDHAVTATQKTILNAFGIDANYIKKKVKESSDNLNPRVLKLILKQKAIKPLIYYYKLII